MKWICEYTELDDDYPIECEPFCFEADTYEEAMEKADKEISKYYHKAEFKVCEKDLSTVERFYEITVD